MILFALASMVFFLFLYGVTVRFEVFENALRHAAPNRDAGLSQRTGDDVEFLLAV